MRSLVLASLLVVAWLPASAAAATVSVDPCGGGGKVCLSAVIVVAAPGEPNRIRVTAEPSAIVVSDAGDGDDQVEVVGDELRTVRLAGGPDGDATGAGEEDVVDGGPGSRRTRRRPDRRLRGR